MFLSFSTRLTIIAGFLIISFSSWSLKAHYTPLPKKQLTSVSNKIEEDVLFYVNEYRSKKGLPALQMNHDISLEAGKHSADMATEKIAFGHDGFEERVRTITKKLGNIHASAENVAYGNLSPKEVVDIWLKSPGHRKNIEGRYTLTGIGIATGKNNVMFFTEIFTDK